MIEQIITVTVLLAVLLFSSVFFEKKIDPCIKYALWLAAVVKLLVPMQDFENRLSIMHAADLLKAAGYSAEIGNRGGEDAGVWKAAGRTDGIQEAEGQTAGGRQAVGNQPAGSEAEGADSKENAGKNAEYKKAAGENAEDRNRNVMADIFKAVWAGGMILCTCIFACSYVRFYRYLKQRRASAGIYKNGPAVYTADGIGTPFLFGIVRPAVYLEPACGLNEQQTEYLLEHEYTHYRHKDHIWAAVRCICVIIYWYHPLVWLAAYRSISDSELACDAGTIRRIGEDSSISYGQALIQAAEYSSQNPWNLRVSACRIGAAGGVKEMKKRVELIVKRPRRKAVPLILALVLCCGAAGCTFGSAAEKETAENAPADLQEDAEGQADAKAPQQEQSDPESPENSKSPESPGSPENPEERAGAVQTDENEAEKPEDDAETYQYMGMTLYRIPEPDKVCISIEPSGVRDYACYYYIPTGSVQKKLLSLLKDMKKNWKKQAQEFTAKGRREAGFGLSYDKISYSVFDDGSLFAQFYEETEENEELNGKMILAPEIYGYVQKLLKNTFDYERADLSKIENLASITLEINSIFTGRKLCRQTITDPKLLEMFAQWFCNAQYIMDGMGCGCENACLTLVMDDGEELKFSAATDSCPIISINGNAYDFRPQPSWGIEYFYKYFDEIDWEENYIGYDKDL